MSPKRPIGEEISQRVPDGAAETPEIVQIVEHLTHLAREQFKANVLQEAALERQRETIAALQETITRQEEMMARLQRNRHEDSDLARRDLILAILPVADGLEMTLHYAKRQLNCLAEGSEARQMLSAWVEGLGLVYQRLMDALAQVGVLPIPAVGQPFDPHLHSAVGVDRSGRAPEGVIVAEERRGYRMRNRVLRYAEVIVSRPVSPPAPPKEMRRATTAAGDMAGQ